MKDFDRRSGRSLHITSDDMLILLFPMKAGNMTAFEDWTLSPSPNLKKLDDASYLTYFFSSSGREVMYSCNQMSPHTVLLAPQSNKPLLHVSATNCLSFSGCSVWHSCNTISCTMYVSDALFALSGHSWAQWLMESHTTHLEIFPSRPKGFLGFLNCVFVRLSDILLDRQSSEFLFCWRQLKLLSLPLFAEELPRWLYELPWNRRLLFV